MLSEKDWVWISFPLPFPLSSSHLPLPRTPTNQPVIGTIPPFPNTPYADEEKVSTGTVDWERNVGAKEGQSVASVFTVHRVLPTP